MTPEPRDSRLTEWVSDLLDGELSPEQEKDLLAALRANEGTACRVINLIQDSCVLQALHSVDDPDAFVEGVLLSALYLDTGDSFTDRVTAAAVKQDQTDVRDPEDQRRVEQIRMRADRQLEAFLAQEREAQVRLGPRRVEGGVTEVVAGVAEKLHRFFNAGVRMAKVAVVCSLVAVAILAVFLYARANRTVATLVGSADAKWDVEIEKNGELRSRRMMLEEGYAQIVLTGGAQVILQAPTTFKVQGPNRMFVESGWITARATGTAKGFTVYSASASVKDFGTEFGFLVGQGRVAEVQVFDGSISLEPTHSGRSAEPVRALNKGDALTIENSGRIQRGVVDDHSHLFVREMPTVKAFGVPGRKLDLADMVGGGNGLGMGTWGMGIYPATGEVILGRRGGNAGRGEGFKPVPASLLFVDGVFVPDGGDGPVTISSTGLTFARCPDTSGQCFDGILDGAVFQSSTEKSRQDHPGRLAGQVYGTPQHPSIGMHANAGMTFDLDKIRTAMAGVDIVRFHSLCGMSETITPYTDGIDGNNGQRIVVDFGVVVDGQQRFSRRIGAVPPETAVVDVPLDRQDRFLTLMTTSPNTVVFCWSMWAEPALELRQGYP